MEAAMERVRNSGKIRSGAVPGSIPAVHLDGLLRFNVHQVLQVYRTTGTTNMQNVYKEAEIYPGVALNGKLCVHATKLGNTVFSAISDEGGDREADAMVVVINNAALKTSSLEHVRTMFPKGAKVAIKEPCLANLAGCGTFLLLSSPAALEFFFSSTPSGSGGRRADQLRQEGNTHFNNKRYVLAGQAYTECMSLAEGDEYLKATGNRAEVFLRLSRYEDAVVDCNKVLSIQPRHSKSLLRKGLALCQLQEHRQALACFDLLVELYKETGVQGIPSVEEARNKCMLLLSQSETGSYDLEEYLLSGFDPKVVPPCSNYVGPVEIRRRANKRLGLFVTRDVNAGDLLLVSSFIATVYAPESYSSSEVDTLSDLMVQVYEAANYSSRLLSQVYALDEAAEEVMDMDVFRTSTGKFDQIKQRPFCSVDMVKVKRVLERATFSSVRKGRNDPHVRQFCGLPGLINHSCLPNVSKMDIGEGGQTFIRAVKDLKAGDELFFCCIDAFEPARVRKRVLSEIMDVPCTCRRCQVEEANDEWLKDIPQDMSLDDDEPDFDSMNQLCKAVDQHLFDPNMTEEEKMWLRAPYSGAFLHLSFNKHLFRNAGRIPSTLEVMKMVHAVAPGVETTLRLLSEAYERIEDEDEEATEFMKKVFGDVFGRHRPEVVDYMIQRGRWTQYYKHQDD